MRRRAHAREEGGEGDHSAPKREGGREESNATKNDSTGDGHINFFADMTQGVSLVAVAVPVTTPPSPPLRWGCS